MMLQKSAKQDHFSFISVAATLLLLVKVVISFGLNIVGNIWDNVRTQLKKYMKKVK